MRELFLRLAGHPFLSIELLLCSFFANLLGLASSIYVIQIFNRYLAYGIDSTLFTLTTGVILALLFEFGFLRVRLKLAATIGRQRNQELANGAFNVLTRAKTGVLQRLSPLQRQEILQGTDTIAEAYNAANLATILDLPFILLFIAALFFLSPPLGFISVTAIILLGLFGFLHQKRLRRELLRLNELSTQTKSIVNFLNQDTDTIRLFEHQQHTRQNFEQLSQTLALHKSRLIDTQNLLQTVMKMAQSLLSVAIYATGAVLTLHGKLDIGMLIGANILAMRTLSPVARASQLSEVFAKATDALQRLHRFALLDTERDGGNTLSRYSGSLVCKDLAFAYPGNPQPLYEHLDLTIPAGTIVAVIGHNGTGKTTLARLLTGLLEPMRGQILIDGIDLRQIAPYWWRRQIGYLPQNSRFLPGTIRDNLMNANPQLDNRRLNEIIADADFSHFIDHSADGLDTSIDHEGTHLTLGQKKRFALARALANDSPLMVFDEPTEGLDTQGCRAIFKLMIKLSRQKRTLIIFTQDSTIIRSAPLLLDLNQKPTPALVKNTLLA